MAKKARRTKKRLFNGLLFRLVAVAMAAGCAIVIITTNRDCAEKENELADIETKITAFEADNAELQRVLEGEDMKDYMEKVALEERGYAYPDERRFYDTSRD